jgi:hypothetical protein
MALKRRSFLRVCGISATDGFITELRDLLAAADEQ